MNRKRNEKIPSWAQTGHAKPVTRREFLAHGLIPFAASMTMPTLLQSLFASTAQAADCPTTAAHSFVPFISLNLAGGAGMGSNYVPTDAGGALLPSYSKMGLGDGQLPISRQFGDVPFAGELSAGVYISKMLQGILSVAQATTLEKTAFVAFCCRSRDDTSENKLDISAMVTQAGVLGTRLPNLGTTNTKTGLSQSAAVITPPAPLVVRSLRDLSNSLGYAGTLSGLNSDQKNRLAKFISDLNSEQSRKLASVNQGPQIQNLLECAGIKNRDIVSAGVSGVDPLGNADVTRIWGLTAGTTNGEAYVFSALTYNALLTQAGTVALNKGGYDYHDNTRTTGNTRDLEAGVIMGRVLETAAVLGKRVCLYVTTDGGVVSTDSATDRQSPWTSDRGSTGIAYMLMFDPAGRPATSGYQVGSFTSGQVADDKFVTGNNPELVAQAVFANYLTLNKRMDLFNQILPKVVLDASALAKVIKVA